MEQGGDRGNGQEPRNVFQTVHRGEPEARIVVLGDGPMEDLEVTLTSNTLVLEASQQEVAQGACQQLRDRGFVVTPDPIYRVLSHATNGRFNLTLGRGDYSQVVGLKANPQWGIPAQVLAVGCVLECPQGLVIERRSDQVAALPGRLHIAPSGSVAPPATVHEALLAEAREELGLEPEELLDQRCLGLVYVETAGVYLLICCGRTEVSLAEMLSRERSGAWEQADLIGAPICPEVLPRWLDEEGRDLTRGARAALLMEGRRRWGSGWFEEHL